MKNLKKVLALGLALVMILGMFTIASAAETKKSAADFTDWDKVEHKDAVALCVDLGIINGLPDGSFAPEQTLDRASWAKLVYFTATGDDNADAYLGTATGMKDITGNWAESYINYLVASKYVSGDGQGNYMPAGTVTVAAGAKTMLTVLGYDADDRGYQNDAAWAGNVITDAKRNGLMDEIARTNTANVNLTRDNAAQLVYNTLLAKIKVPEYRRDNGVTYVVKYEDGIMLLRDVFGVEPVEAMVDDVTDGIGAFSGSEHDALLNGADIKASASNIGNKVTVFITTDGKSVISSAVAKAGSTADKTITGGIRKVEDLVHKDTGDYKDDFIANAVGSVTVTSAEAPSLNWLGSMKVYKDGAEVTTSPLAATAKSGDVVEVFLTEGKVSMVKITTYSVEKVDGEIETRVYKDEEQVKVPGVTGLTSFISVDKVDGWQGLADGDVLLVNTSKGVTYLEKADKVTGTITRRIAEKLTINNKQYAASGIATDALKGEVAAWDPQETKGNEYDFYLDKNGDICLYEQVSGDVTTEVAYVLDAAYKNTGANNGLDGGDEYQQAKLLFTDGTTQIVRVNKLYNAETKKMDKVEEDKSEAINTKLVDFSVDSKGYYELTVKAEATATGTAISQEPDFVEGLKADEKTVFMVEKTSDDDSEFFVYTSYENVPKMEASVIHATANDKGYVTYVYLQTDKFAGEGSEGLIYLKDASYVEKDTEGNSIFQFVTAEGREEDLSVTFADGSSAKDGAFYVITATDENGAVTLKEAEEGAGKDYVAATDATAVKVGAGVVTVNGTGYNTKGVVCVQIDEDADGFVAAAPIAISKVSTTEDGYTYQVLLIADGTSADFLYVVRTATPSAT